MTGLGHDVGHALRLLVKNPGFTAVVVLTLALAIGVNTSVFSIVNAVLFKPLPVEDPEGLVHIYTAVPDGFLSHEPMAHPDFEDVRNEVKSLSHVVGYAFTRFVLETSEDNELILGELASGDYFEMLGLRPAAGRFFSLEDDRRGAASSVAVLSHATWQKRFGGDPSIVGSEIRLNGHPVTVLGVAPEGFRGLTRALSAELWIPIQLSRTVTAASRRGRTPRGRAGFRPRTSPKTPRSSRRKRARRRRRSRCGWRKRPPGSRVSSYRTISIASFACCVSRSPCLRPITLKQPVSSRSSRRRWKAPTGGGSTVPIKTPAGTFKS